MLHSPAIRNSYTFVYSLINAFASAFCLYLVLDASIIEWPKTGALSSLAAKVILSGLGAMAILRLGVSVQISGETLNISIANIIKPVLRAADSEVDRARASHKLKVTKDLMLSLNADTALKELPILCLYLMQSIPEEDQKQLASDVKALSEQQISDDSKLISMGSLLLNAVGENVLRNAVASFKESYTKKDDATKISRADATVQSSPIASSG